MATVKNLWKYFKYSPIYKEGEQVKIENLTEKDVGAWVVYNKFPDKILGRIKSWNKKYVFVVYDCEYNWKEFYKYTGEVTLPENLKFLKQKEDI